jgi:hypothetical protein
MAVATDMIPDYPVHFDVERPTSQSRLTNFPLGIGIMIRYIILIPNFIVLYFLGIVALLLHFIATFAILFTGKYPAGMYNFVSGYIRWSANVTSYLTSLHDKYPPFSTDQQAGYPLTLELTYPETSSRLLNFPLLGFVIKELLLIPHLIVLVFLGLISYVVLFIAQFAILFTGAYPEGMHKFVVGVTRWGIRVQCYFLGMTDKYPPFSTN